MKNVNWSTVAAVTLLALAIFMTWGALGGWIGTMGPGWSMMGSGWGIWSPDPSMAESAGGMFFLLLVFIALFAALVLWVVRSSKK
jgi:hypothetical protein